jgi:membrane protein implicated in regulation of membrane protease activity
MPLGYAVDGRRAAGKACEVHIWFWAWVLLTAVFAAMELLDRGMYTLPWAFGTATAALLEYFGVWVGWQWIAFLLVSSIAFVSVRLFVRPGRKSLRRAGLRPRP